MGYNVLSGQHGLKVRIPIHTTWLKINNEEFVKLSEATAAQKEAYQKGMIEGFEKLSFGIGNVFDISQTDFPKDQYPKLFNMGYPSAQHLNICRGIEDFTEKGVISSVEGQDDYDITLIGNDFTIYEKEDYEEGKVKYLSTTYHLFRDPYFRTLKPKQKLLVMDLLNIQMAGRPNGVNTYRIYRENFIKKYANIKQNDGTKSKGLLDITVRTLQKYFKLLKHYFSVSLKNGMYFFTLKSKFAKSGVSHTTENHITTQHLVKAACRRNKIKDPDVKEQEKIEKVLENREKEVLNRFVNISDVIRSMIETINEKIPDPRKWSRRLKATLFIKKFNEAVS